MSDCFLFRRDFRRLAAPFQKETLITLRITTPLGSVPEHSQTQLAQLRLTLQYQIQPSSITSIPVAGCLVFVCRFSTFPTKFASNEQNILTSSGTRQSLHWIMIRWNWIIHDCSIPSEVIETAVRVWPWPDWRHRHYSTIDASLTILEHSMAYACYYGWLKQVLGQSSWPHPLQSGRYFMQIRVDIRLSFSVGKPWRCSSCTILTRPNFPEMAYWNQP